MWHPMNTRVCLTVCCLTIVFWLVSCANAGFQCVEPSNVHSSYKCYRSVKAASNSSPCQPNNTCDPRNNAMTWTSLNSTSGLFEASFLLASPSCNYSTYNMLLKIHANAVSSQQECEAVSEFELIHSKRVFSVEDVACCTTDNCSICEKTGSVRFQYVFSGCYRLEIWPMSGSNSHNPIKSCPIYLESRYTKELISAEKPLFTVPEIADQHSPVVISFSFVPLTCSRLKLEIKLMKDIDGAKDKPCYKSGITHSHCTIGAEETSCNESETLGPPASCEMAADQVICTFKPISHGNYCTIVEILDDDRCNRGTLWTLGSDGRSPNTCKWHNEFYRVATGSNPEEDASHSYALFGGIVVVSLIVALAAVWIKFKHLRARRFDQGDETGGALADGGMDGGALNPQARRGVLLLYARDCEPFMHLMQSFRRLLEDAVKLEVYDCFDASRWEQVSRSPTEWVRRLALHPEVKVIAVASTCAALRLEAHLANAQLHYAQPTCMDDLFVYALQLLGDNVHRDNGYQKMFVVRFDGFSDDLDLFTHLNTYTRYVLPAHFNLLVKSLHPSTPDQSLQLMEQDLIRTIQQDLKKLVNYKSENENYLEDYLLFRKCS